MLRLDRVIKPWRESAALNAHINLFSFWNETAFLTKSGDLGMVLRISGIDYESLDNSEQDYAVKRLESALKGFGVGFHVYQYLFKSNRPDIPFATYDDPLIDAAIDQRRQFFGSKRDRLYQIEIFYVILLEGTRSKPSLLATLGKMSGDPQGAIQELKARFSSNATKRLLRSEIDADLVKLTQRVENFSRQLADLTAIETQGKEASFTFFRRLVNFDDWRIAGKPRADQFLDYQVVNTTIEAERDHLRVGNHTIRKFSTIQFTIADLIKTDALSAQLAEYLAEQIAIGKTLLISGGTSSGKTTFLNALTDYIPVDERIVVIEDTRELRLNRRNLLAAECQTDAHTGTVSFNDLLKSALRWRPDRIILGEVRGDEARTLLDSFNTGHGGSMATIHASTAARALRKFGQLAMRSHEQANRDDISSEIGESVQLVIQLQRYPDGRKVTEMIELDGYDRDRKIFCYRTIFDRSQGTTVADDSSPVPRRIFPITGDQNDAIA